MKQIPEKVNIPIASKHRQVKELENPIESKDLEMINLVNYMHNMIWVMEKQKHNGRRKQGSLICVSLTGHTSICL